MENNDLFRKNAVERVTSPEQLNDYIHVTSPAIWMILAGIIVILAGVFVWGVAGRLESYEVGAGVAYGGELTVYVSPQVRTKLKEGMKMSVQEKEMKIELISGTTEQVPNDIDPYILSTAGLENGEQAYVLKSPTDLPDGVYSVSIQVESIRPIEFVVH